MLADARAHTTLPTADIDRLRAWYEDVLGFTPFAVRPGAVLYGRRPGASSRSRAARSLSIGTHTQMAFTVDDIEAEVADLRARGVVFETYESPRPIDGIAHDRAGSRGLVQGSRRQPAGDPAVRRSGLSAARRGRASDVTVNGRSSARREARRR